ncbi:MAG: 23S rRNA (uracil(1939)-C(5))-methyltransferase RlmD [Deltaproteobacteria bacterium]
MTQTNPKSEVTLEIDALSYGPYGIGRLQGKAVMIPATAPGDTVAARILETKERYNIGEVLRIMTPSQQRQTPPCPYVGSCGGCSWQHLRYDAQLRGKQQSVNDALRRIGKLADFELRPIIASPLEYHYRRRIRLQCNELKQLGFFRSSSHHVIEIASCHIADPETERHLASVRRWIGQLASSIQYVEIVAGDETNQTIIVAGSAGAFIPGDETVARKFLEQTPSIAGIIMRGRDWRHTWGQTVISVRTEEGVYLKIDGDVFTQVNREGNRRLLSELVSAGPFGTEDRVLELYCGAGNFTLSLAKRVREVIAVEASRASIENGKRSAQLNGIENIRWKTADVPLAVKRLKQRGERFTKIVLDPPRPGAPGIQADLAALGAEKILYVSCNPTTLARDLAAFSKNGYRLQWVQPVDLFPHTFHVESLAVMVQ